MELLLQRKEGGLAVSLNFIKNNNHCPECRRQEPGPDPKAAYQNYIPLKDNTHNAGYVYPKHELKRGGRGGSSMPADQPLGRGLRGRQ